MKMTTGLAVGIGVGPFATKQPEGSSNALDVITSSNGAWWVVKERDGSNNLVDQTGGGRNLTLPGGSANPVLLDHSGTDYFWFPGTAGNNLSIAGLSNSTTYDYTVTYSDTTTNTGSETTDGSGNLVFGNTQANFNLKKVTKIEVEPSGGGALVADVRATSADPDATTFAELVSALTVTINRSSTGYKTAVVDQPLYVFATDDYLYHTITGSEFEPTGDFSVVAVVRRHGTFSSGALHTIVTTRQLGTTSNGFFLGYRQTADNDVLFNAADADTTVINEDAGAFDSAVLTAWAGTRSGDTFTGYKDGVAGAGVTEAAMAAIPSEYNQLVVGAEADTSTRGQFADMELVGIAYIDGTAWSSSELVDIANALITANGGTP